MHVALEESSVRCLGFSHVTCVFLDRISMKTFCLRTGGRAFITALRR